MDDTLAFVKEHAENIADENIPILSLVLKGEKPKTRKEYMAGIASLCKSTNPSQLMHIFPLSI